MDDGSLGARLKALREKRGVSQEDLAKAMAVSASTLSRIESGRRRLEAQELLKALDFLKARLADFRVPPGPELPVPPPGGSSPEPVLRAAGSSPGASTATPAANPLRYVARLAAALVSAYYLAREAREFLGRPPLPLKGFSPELYLGLLALAFTSREALAWRGEAEELSSFEAGWIAASWWLLVLAAMLGESLRPGFFRLPPDLLRLACEATAAVTGAKAAAYARKARLLKRGKAPPDGPAAAAAAEAPCDAWAESLTFLAFAALFGLFMGAPGVRGPGASQAAAPIPRPPSPALPPAPRRASAFPEGPGGARPTASTAPRPPGPLLAKTAEFSRWLLGSFPDLGPFFARSEGALPFRPLVLAAPGGPAPGYEYLQEDGVRWLFPESFRAPAALAADFNGHELFWTQLFPESRGARPRLEGENPGLHLGQLLLYPEASPGLDVFFILGPRVYQGWLLHDRPPRLAVPGRRFKERPAGFVFFLEGSARALPGKPDLLGVLSSSNRNI